MENCNFLFVKKWNQARLILNSLVLINVIILRKPGL
jgi:hypothetical protein